nr:uncharacterized protein LOC123758272 [Procambarus clarkii]
MEHGPFVTHGPLVLHGPLVTYGSLVPQCLLSHTTVRHARPHSIECGRRLSLLPLLLSLLLQAPVGSCGPPPTALQYCPPQPSTVIVTQTVSQHVTQTSFRTLVHYESTVSTEWLTETVTQAVTQAVTQHQGVTTTTTTITYPHSVTLRPQCPPITGYGGQRKDDYQG